MAGFHLKTFIAKLGSTSYVFIYFDCHLKPGLSVILVLFLRIQSTFVCENVLALKRAWLN